MLAALGARLSNAQIANRLHISVRTVESHVSSLLRKYGVADRWALAEMARSDAGEPGRIAGLPASGTTFVGRGAERAAVLAAIEEARLVTLLGPGGVGKTRLAAVVAEDAVALLPSGGAFVDLVPVRDGFVARAVATALGVTEGSHQPLTEAVAARLGTRRSLLVLDNCEHVIDEAAEFAERILAACPATRVLVTSRERLGVPGERSVPISPLPLGSDAERLFYDRALAADPQFVAEPGAIAELCARLDGLPLAIELAAARGASLGASGLLAALEDALRLLSGARGGDERHRFLCAVLTWSYDLLGEEEQTLFRRLGVFVGAFDIDAAAAVGGDRPGVADLLGRLADKSLVVHLRGRVSRWRLLETVRAFTLAQMSAAGEEDKTKERLLGWAVDAASAAEGRLSDPAWREDFDAMAADLRAALTASDGPARAPARPPQRRGRDRARRRSAGRGVRGRGPGVAGRPGQGRAGPRPRIGRPRRHPGDRGSGTDQLRAVRGGDRCAARRPAARGQPHHPGTPAAAAVHGSRRPVLRTGDLQHLRPGLRLRDHGR